MTSDRISARKNMIKVLLPLVFFVAVAALGGFLVLRGQPQGTAGVAPQSVGATVPDFDLPLYRGKEVKFSQLEGKVFLINFWATWCEACVVEMPSILRLREKFYSKGLRLVPINLDENPEAVLPQALSDLNMSALTIYTDRNASLVEFFDVHAIPLTVILNSSGQILMIENGERDWDSPKIHQEMEKWLSG